MNEVASILQDFIIIVIIVEEVNFVIQGGVDEVHYVLVSFEVHNGVFLLVDISFVVEIGSGKAVKVINHYCKERKDQVEIQEVLLSVVVVEIVRKAEIIDVNEVGVTVYVLVQEILGSKEIDVG